MNKWPQQIENLKEKNQAFVMITLVNIEGSSPQDVGARAFVSSKELLAGTVGGGKLELKAIDHAQSLLENESSTAKFDFKQWNLKKDVGMTCGGVVSLFFEVYRPVDLWNIAVFGAGHVAQEVVRLLLTLNCHIFCVDPRQEWLDKLPTNSKLQKIKIENMNEFVSKLPPRTFIASLTMGHAFDLPILVQAMNLDHFPYIGAIGSKSKSLVLKNDLKNLGIPQQKIERLICPIGEKIGCNDPAEIAISIVSQMLKTRDSLNMNHASPKVET